MVRGLQKAREIAEAAKNRTCHMKVEDALQNFRHAVESERLAHGYIIAGSPRDEGTMLAEQVLRLVFCTEKKKACGKCRGCVQVKDHMHPDILWVEPQMKSRKISVDQIRDLQRQVFQTSYSGGWKACVIVGADRIGEQAANAFLKTLEEPPKKCIFLLLTDSPQFLLPTVVSRCQPINVSSGELRLPGDLRGKVVDIMKSSIFPVHGKRSTVAALGTGERFAGLLNEIKKEIEEEEYRLAEEGALDEDDDTVEARISSRYREIRSAIIRAILLWYRDILMLVCGQDRGLVFQGDAYDCLTTRAKTLSVRAALRNVQTIEEMNRQLERNMPDKTVLDFGFSRLN